MNQGHEVRREWKHLCFIIIECTCGATFCEADWSRKELYRKWDEHAPRDD